MATVLLPGNRVAPGNCVAAPSLQSAPPASGQRRSYATPSAGGLPIIPYKGEHGKATEDKQEQGTVQGAAPPQPRKGLKRA
jgi:hypothetical protein